MEIEEFVLRHSNGIEEFIPQTFSVDFSADEKPLVYEGLPDMPHPEFPGEVSNKYFEKVDSISQVLNCRFLKRFLGWGNSMPSTWESDLVRDQEFLGFCKRSFVVRSLLKGDQIQIYLPRAFRIGHTLLWSHGGEVKIHG